jgi:Cu(I)/Ag(I) efflux system membrane protein CusA/SilA
MTYYGRKINIVLIKNRAIVLPRFRLFGWESIVQENPIDAIPDLSENQVIVFTVDG